MTTRDQVGQLFMVGIQETSVSEELATFLKKYRPGGIILFARNLETPSQMACLTNDLQRLATGSPLFISIDQEGGRVSRLPPGFTIFPPCEVFGTCQSADLAYAAAKTTATELRAVGINMNLAPVLDINTNPSNPIIGNRAFGTSPAQVSELGSATIKGLQDQHVMACGKHFPGHGDTATDSHKELPVVSASAAMLHERELQPFRDAITIGVASIMTAHVVYPALDDRTPATLSKGILTDLLRHQLQFNGLILTDDLEMQAILAHHHIDAAAIQAFQAGADILLIGENRGRAAAAMEAVHDAVENGTISNKRLNASLDRIAQAKSRFLHSYQPVDPDATQHAVGIPTHRSLLDTILKTSKQRLRTSA